jgi:hypothetical protein
MLLFSACFSLLVLAVIGVVLYRGARPGTFVLAVGLPLSVGRAHASAQPPLAPRPPRCLRSSAGFAFSTPHGSPVAPGRAQTVASNFFCGRTTLSDLELRQKVSRQGPWRATPGGTLARHPTRAQKRLHGGRPPMALGVRRTRDHYHYRGMVQNTASEVTARARVYWAQVQCNPLTC